MDKMYMLKIKNVKEKKNILGLDVIKNIRVSPENYSKSDNTDCVTNVFDTSWAVRPPSHNHNIL